MDVLNFSTAMVLARLNASEISVRLQEDYRDLEIFCDDVPLILSCTIDFERQICKNWHCVATSGSAVQNSLNLAFTKSLTSTRLDMCKLMCILFA